MTPCRSSNATADVAFSSAFSRTEAGGELRRITPPLDPEMSAAATDAVENASTAVRHAMTIFLGTLPFAVETRPRPCTARFRWAERRGVMGTPLTVNLPRTAG